MSRSKLGMIALFGIALAAAAPSVYSRTKVHAQINDEALPDKDAATPTFTGHGKITEAINGDTGAIFDLGGGVIMSFPRGLPVGRSRLVTLQKGKALPSAIVHPKWKALGPALDFTGAFNTGGKPIVLAIGAKSDPVKTGQKLVLAMEVGSFCDGPNKAFKLKNNLCSGFELVGAEYDSSGRRMVANLRSTGGLRMQFGLVPSD